MSQPDVADLDTQLEDILSAVWSAESNWRFDDRLDLALGHQPPHSRRPANGQA